MEWSRSPRDGDASADAVGVERLNTPFRRTLVRLLARSRGGRNRFRILKLLRETGPLNANQIAGMLSLHYTTVQHHLKKLLRDDVIAASPRGDSYGAVFLLTYQMERHARFLEEVLPLLDRLEAKAQRAARRSSPLGAASP